MAQAENKQLIQSLYDAFAQGNAQYILDRVTDDVEWRNEGPESVPYMGQFNGKAGVRRFFEQFATVQAGKVTAHEFIVTDDKVIALGRFTATVTATRKKIDAAIAHVFTIRDGKVTRWLGYGDTAASVEAYSAP